MTQGIEFIENIYGQLHGAGIVRSKGDFSERLLGKSPSYLTSMRAKQRVVSSAVIMGLGDNIMAEVGGCGSDPDYAETQAALRRAVAQINYYLADQTIPAGLTPALGTGAKLITPPHWLTTWLRMLVGNAT